MARSPWSQPMELLLPMNIFASAAFLDSQTSMLKLASSIIYMQLMVVLEQHDKNSKLKMFV